MAKKILCVPTKNHIGLVFSDRTLRRLKGRFEVTFNDSDRDYATSQIARSIVGYDGLITGWGSPVLDGSVFENADRLRIIAHSAGSVKQVLPKEVVRRYIVPRKICVCNARKAIAYNVAEFTIGLLIVAGHRIVDHAISMRERGVWGAPDIPINVRTLNGATVGVVSASEVGREVIRLLRPFDLKVLVYDPYLTRTEAKRLGVHKTTLKGLFRRSDFVTVHSPLTDETVNMIGESHLKLLRDDAVLVNTSRGRVIDQEALLRQCQTGRIRVALDVIDPEPLPADSPFRGLPNVILTPHIAGAGIYGYNKIGDITLRALEDFFAGREVLTSIDPREYDILA